VLNKVLIFILIFNCFFNLSDGNQIKYAVSLNFSIERWSIDISNPVEIRVGVSIKAYEENVTGCPVLKFKGNAEITIEVTNDLGKIDRKTIKYKGGIVTLTKILLSGNSGVIRIIKVNSSPKVHMILENLTYYRIENNLIVMFSTDYHQRYLNKIFGIIGIIKYGYNEMMEIVGYKTPLLVKITTIRQCCRGGGNIATIPVQISNDLLNFNDNDVVSEWGTIFHELTHAILNSNDDVFRISFWWGGDIKYNMWFCEGLADYIGRLYIPRLFLNKSNVYQKEYSHSLHRYNYIFNLILENKGTIVNNKYRKTSDAGKNLQIAWHPEMEGAGLLLYLEKFKRNYIFDLYHIIKLFKEELMRRGFRFQPGYAFLTEYGWKAVWGQRDFDPYVRDTILIKFLSKAVGRDLVEFFRKNLSYTVYDDLSVKNKLPSPIYNAYIETLNKFKPRNPSTYCFYINISSKYSSATEPGWYSKNHYINVSIRDVTIYMDHKVIVFKGWYDLDTKKIISTSKQILLKVNENISLVARWEVKINEIYINVSSDYSQASGSGWYLINSLVKISIKDTIIEYNNYTRMIFRGWLNESGKIVEKDSVFTIKADKSYSFKALWIKEYYINVSSDYSQTNGSGWYPDGSIVNISISETRIGELFYNIIFLGWSDETNTIIATTQNYSFMVNKPKKIVAVWRREINMTIPLSIVIITILIILIIVLLLKRKKKTLPPPPPPI